MSEKPMDIEAVLTKIENCSDFPVLSQSITNINELAKADNQDVAQIASVIVKDFGLTNKILKVVNSAFYGRFAGEIGTISRAIVVLGIETIRSLAASLIFFDHIKDKKHAQRLKDLVSTSLYSGILARELSGSSDDEERESYFLTAFIHNLGDILVAFYMPDEDEKIHNKIKQNDMAPKLAQQESMGIHSEEIASFVADKWNFPVALVESIPSWPSDKKPKTKAEQRRVMADLSTEATDLILNHGADDKAAIAKLLAKYKGILKMDDKKLTKAIASATEKFSQIGDAMPGDISPEFIERLNGVIPEEIPEQDSMLVNALDALIEEDTRPDPESILTDGLQEVTGMLASEAPLTEIFSVVIETIYRALDCEKVILAVHNKKTGEMVGRLGFGNGAQAFNKKFHMPSKYEKDIFHAVMKKQVDVYINDTSDPKITRDLPGWYKSITDAGCFLLLPVIIRDQPIALIYAEDKEKDGLTIDKKKLNLLKSLRNQMVLACK